MLPVLVGGADGEDSRIHRGKLNAQCGRSIADAGDDDNVGCEGSLQRQLEAEPMARRR